MYAALTSHLFIVQRGLNAYDYQLSADHKYAAFMSNYTKVRTAKSVSFFIVVVVVVVVVDCNIWSLASVPCQQWRHSFNASYTIYDVVNKYVSSIYATGHLNDLFIARAVTLDTNIHTTTWLPLSKVT